MTLSKSRATVAKMGRPMLYSAPMAGTTNLFGPGPKVPWMKNERLIPRCTACGVLSTKVLAGTIRAVKSPSK
ncbi:hypothetical protein D3C86_2146190 [compost metagenome]